MGVHKHTHHSSENWGRWSERTPFTYIYWYSIIISVTSSPSWHVKGSYSGRFTRLGSMGAISEICWVA